MKVLNSSAGRPFWDTKATGMSTAATVQVPNSLSQNPSQNVHENARENMQRHLNQQFLLSSLLSRDASAMGMQGIAAVQVPIDPSQSSLSDEEILIDVLARHCHTVESVNVIQQFLGSAPAGIATRLIDWIGNLDLRLDAEVFSIDDTSNDQCLAEHIQIRIGTRLGQLTDHIERHPNNIEGFISGTAVAAGLLWAAPPPERCTQYDLPLIAKLEQYAAEAQDTQWRKIKKYIDDVWKAAPGTMKMKLYDLRCSD